MLLRSCEVQQLPVIGSHCAPPLHEAPAVGAVNKGADNIKPVLTIAAEKAATLNLLTLMSLQYGCSFDAIRFGIQSNCIPHSGQAHRKLDASYTREDPDGRHITLRYL